MHISTPLSLFLLPLLPLINANPLGSAPPGKHDCKGSFACLLMPSGACNLAVLGYLPNETYTGYTARIASKKPKSKGCTAIYSCETSEAYNDVVDGGPPNGTYLGQMFAALFTFDSCGKCGHHKLANPKCQVKTDYCAHCEPTATDLAQPLRPYRSNGTNSTGTTGGNMTVTMPSLIPIASGLVGTS